MNRYVIITPAHNEEAFIEKTIASVISQTVRPVKWVIVNDASTDRTREIVERHSKEQGFIQLVDINRSAGRHFGNKVRAFKQGLAQVRDLQFDYIGNLDADISCEPTYFECILGEFTKDPQLGIAGGMVHTRVGEEHVSQEVALDSVAGAVQLFRRECFDQVGGYMPLPNGGEDSAAEFTARMRGWKTRTFPERRVLEHRLTGSAKARPVVSRMNEGRRMYSLGYGCWFFGFRCVYRALDKPRVLGSLAAFLGFIDSKLRRRPIVLQPELVRFVRSEQNQKLRRLFRFPGSA